MENHYTTLGVSRDATTKEVEKAYKKQALVSHPDRKPAHQKAEATAMFQKLAEAYDVLKDEASRKRYDQSLLSSSALNLPTSPPGSGARAYSAAPPTANAGPRRPSSTAPPQPPPAPPPTSPPRARRDSYSRPSSTSPPTRAHAHGAPPPPPPASTFRAPPPRSSGSSRRPLIDPFKVFAEAWGGRPLEDIESELQHALYDREGWASGRPRPEQAKSQSWDERPWASGRGNPHETEGLGRDYQPMARPAHDPRQRRQSQSGYGSSVPARPRSTSVFGVRGNDGGGGQPVSEISMTTVRVERLANGSVHLSREMKTQTITDDGTVHVRHRRQNAGVEYDEPSSNRTYTPERPPLKVSTSAARPSYARRDSGASERLPSSYTSRPSATPLSPVRPPPSRQGSYIYSPTSAEAPRHFASPTSAAYGAAALAGRRTPAPVPLQRNLSQSGELRAAHAPVPQPPLVRSASTVAGMAARPRTRSLSGRGYY